jgi:hypothetical protein
VDGERTASDRDDIAQFAEAYEEIQLAPPLSPTTFARLLDTPSFDPYPSLHNLPFRTLKDHPDALSWHDSYRFQAPSTSNGTVDMNAVPALTTPSSPQTPASPHTGPILSSGPSTTASPALPPQVEAIFDLLLPLIRANPLACLTNAVRTKWMQCLAAGHLQGFGAGQVHVCFFLEALGGLSPEPFAWKCLLSTIPNGRHSKCDRSNVVFACTVSASGEFHDNLYGIQRIAHAVLPRIAPAGCSTAHTACD